MENKAQGDSPHGPTNFWGFLIWLFSDPSRVAMFLFAAVVLAKIADISGWNWAAIGLNGGLINLVTRIKKMLD
jgi:ABC-type uncharacterized transport system permease subunit